ncbi:MAG: DUF5685 family protein [Desulfobacterales bacterium]
MFGIIRGCGLEPCQREEWKAHYCGLCMALGKYHGQAARMMLNGDGVLLSVLCEAQSRQLYERTVHRCLFAGGKALPVADPDAPGPGYASLVSAFMASALISDHIRDGDGRIRYAKGFFSNLARKWHQSARNLSSVFGFEPESIEKQLQQQNIAEQCTGRDFLFWSQPTELAAAAAAVHTAKICHMPQNLEPLFEIGRMFGRILFLLDSYRDYAQDQAGKKFNALARSFLLHQMQENARMLFGFAHEELRKNFAKLRLFHPDTAESLFTVQLSRIGEQCLAMSPGILNEKAKKRKFSDRFGCSRNCHCDCCCDDCCECAECGDNSGCDCGSCCDGCDCG